MPTLLLLNFTKVISNDPPLPIPSRLVNQHTVHPSHVFVLSQCEPALQRRLSGDPEKPQIPEAQQRSGGEGSDGRRGE